MSLLRSRSLHLLAFLLFTLYYLRVDEIGLITYVCIAFYAALIVGATFLPPVSRWRYIAEMMRHASASMLIGCICCTSGLGYGMLQLFAKQGWNVIINGRNVEKLKEIEQEMKEKYNVQCVSVAQDLGEADAADKIIIKLKALGFHFDSAIPSTDAQSSKSSSSTPPRYIDVLINNAGEGSSHLFLHNSLPHYISMLNCHALATTALTYHVLPSMLKRRGRIVQIASMIGYLPSPRAAVYAAVKAYIISFTKSVEYEIGLEMDRRSRRKDVKREEEGVVMSLVTPGPTHTNFSARASDKPSMVFKLGLTADSQQVCQEIVAGVIEGKKDISPGLFNRFTIFLLPKLPLKFSQFCCFLLWGSMDVKEDFFGTRLVGEEGGKMK